MMAERSLVRGALALAAAGMIVGLLGPGASATEAGAPPGKEIFLIQGTPGVSVDVSVDGSVVARNMKAKDVIGPLHVAPGRHVVRFDSGTWVVPASFEVSRPSSDVMLHRSALAAPKPVVTVFDNDLDPVALGKGRLVIAHTAVVPPADVRVDGQVLFANIANGEFVSAVVPARTYSADIVPTGQDDPLFGPVDIPVKAGALTRVFAIGQPTNGGMDAIVQVLGLTSAGSSTPQHVDTGSAGLVGAPPRDTGDATDVSWLLLGLTAALLVVARSRRRVVG